MLCQRCEKRDATSHENVRNDDGTWTEVHLCDSCCGKAAAAPLSPTGIMQAIIESAATMAATQEATSVPSCPSCGMTYSEFRSKGRLGCGRDYEVFEAELLPLLERIHHGGVQHVGKSPESTPGRSDAERELIELRRALAEAVQREQYEEAARLRDRVRVLDEARAAANAAADDDDEHAVDDPTDDDAGIDE